MAKILIMEDDESQSFLLSDALETRGHRVVLSASASEALTQLESQKFDLLITDLFVRDGEAPIPDGGILLIGRVRAPGKLAKYEWMTTMPILAISGKSQSPGLNDILVTAQTIGADRSLMKPVGLPTLFAVVDELLAKSRDTGMSA